MVFALVCACGACSKSTDPDLQPNRELDCEREDYPCTLGEVPTQVLERSDQLADDAYARIRGGESVAVVADSLRGQGDVVTVKNDDGALWFRVEGGRPHWVVSDAAFPDVPPGAPPELPRLDNRGANPSTTVHGQSEKDIVGPFPEQKRALVLSPYLYEFGGYDDGPLVAALLRDARGYADNVVFKANTSLEDPTIRGGDFNNWDAFDVVHISSHGSQICNSSGQNCDLYLFQGDRITSEVDVVLATPGYVVVTSLIPESYAVSADYFRVLYPNGLSETIVSFSACETTEGPEFAQIFANPSSVFFGWSKSVLSSFAYFATATLFQRLIDTGRTTRNVYEELVDEELTVDPSGATLQRDEGGDDLRIREIITAYAPGADPSPDTELKDDDPIPFRVAEDEGGPDRMDFNVQIEGVEEDDDLGDFVVHISVNGTEATQTWTLDQARQTDTYTYRLEDVADFGIDFGDLDLFDVQFWVELPEGGESRFAVELTPASWTMRFSGPYLSGTYSGSTAELALRNAFGSGNILIFETGDVDQTPEVRINTTWFAPIMSGENVFELRAPPAFAGPDELEGAGLSVITFRDVVDDGMGTLGDAGVVNGDGVTTVIQPDESVYTSPRPPTLTLFDYDPNRSTVRGSIEGPYGVCYGFVDLGPQGFCDTYQVSIDFSAVQDIVAPEQN